MKRIQRIFLVMLFLNAASSFGQFVSRPEGTASDFKNVGISFYKTTSIVFPYPIKSMDKGSGEILVQKAKGVENILLLKAAAQNFRETNLTVITAEGKLYGFTIRYDESCPDLNVKADKLAVVNDDIMFSLENENQKKIEQSAVLALSKKKKINGLRRSKFEMKLAVDGIFIHEDIIYFRLTAENGSKINYEVDQLRFFIRDQKKSKRTASQEIEIVPLYAVNGLKIIADKSKVSAVYAIAKFTIPDRKYLTVQLFEKNGGRHLEVDLNSSLADKVFPL